MNEEIMRELVGYDEASFNNENLNSVNIEIMREVAAEETNDNIIVNGENVTSLTETISFTTAEMMTLTFAGGLYATKESETPVGKAYKGNDYWFIYKVTNSNGGTNNPENATQVILTDTIPTNFTIYDAVSVYSIDNNTSPVVDAALVVDGQNISTPTGETITRDNTNVTLGTLTIEPGKTLTAYVKVKLDSVQA
ncbi:MAG: hypothetical protein Q4B63_06385 [Clostridium perfringens]|nr:hypothetical protein [Clostridium perfringens]